MFYIKQELPTNRQIRAKEVQLIGENGEKLGVNPFEKALEIAEQIFCMLNAVKVPSRFFT